MSVLLATAVAPTDPAVVFSVLGQREVSGRGDVILKGESGANDPVGIALMASLIAAGGLSAGAFAHVGGEFLLQMAVGAAVGVAGGAALLWFMRRVPLPGEGLYPLRTLACALLLFAVATLAHGSGFLAVFTAGIVLGDGRAPYKREVERFHSALASLAEIVAFIVLGLTISLDVIGRADVWVPGLVLGAALAFVIRPVLVGLCLVPARLGAASGLRAVRGAEGGRADPAGQLPARRRGAGRAAAVRHRRRGRRVLRRRAGRPGARRRPAAARADAPVEPEPWALGVRLRDEPSGVPGSPSRPASPADGRTVDEGRGLPGEAWISIIVRDGQLVPVKGGTRIRAGDDILGPGRPGAARRGPQGLHCPARKVTPCRPRRG